MLGFGNQFTKIKEILNEVKKQTAELGSKFNPDTPRNSFHLILIDCLIHYSYSFQVIIHFPSRAGQGRLSASVSRAFRRVTPAQLAE